MIGTRLHNACVHSPILRGVEEGTCGSIRVEEGMIGVLTAREKTCKQQTGHYN